MFSLGGVLVAADADPDASIMDNENSSSRERSLSAMVDKSPSAVEEMGLRIFSKVCSCLFAGGMLEPSLGSGTPSTFAAVNTISC